MTGGSQFQSAGSAKFDFTFAAGLVCVFGQITHEGANLLAM
jgi:hypothetical protein